MEEGSGQAYALSIAPREGSNRLVGFWGEAYAFNQVLYPLAECATS
jgi:hypothetical protein